MLRSLSYPIFMVPHNWEFPSGTAPILEWVLWQRSGRRFGLCCLLWTWYLRVWCLDGWHPFCANIAYLRVFTLPTSRFHLLWRFSLGWSEFWFYQRDLRRAPVTWSALILPYYRRRWPPGTVWCWDGRLRPVFWPNWAYSSYLFLWGSSIWPV